ncbi:alpha/beta fold hydrolase [Anderseniella sp. Alg231-50]|uniref:alpha/beta fold hydrolase n=1 Tax=Anderseniella sp. Alg231-50 TaxID=1922226 RepID=UPI000D54C5D4
MAIKSTRIEFPGSQGGKLAARLDAPSGTVRGYALFAHCFTCSKDVFAASRIASALASHGVATLRFDFTGLGASEGEFANTNFSSNVADLIAAADWLRDNHAAPELLIGHSLGGAAVLAGAGHIAELKAVATIGAPADADHVVHNFQASLDTIEADGEATVSLAGREFTIKKQFLDDVRGTSLKDRIAALKPALIVFHAPLDQTVGIENASAIFSAARHPKSFVSLDGADHLLSRRQDAVFVADVLAGWANRFLPSVERPKSAPAGVVRVRETRQGKFQQDVLVDDHHLLADEPSSVGGDGTGPSPYDYLSIALGTCTSMTLRMYADFKKLELGRVTVDVSHGKVHADDCKDCGEGKTGKIDRFERTISVDGEVSPELRGKLEEIAGKCPVHRTLEAEAAVVTKVIE